jgi:hypothetical protein
MAKQPAASESQATAAEPARPATVQWIDKNMATHFANVVNVQSKSTCFSVPTRPGTSPAAAKSLSIFRTGLF